jgi:D-serine deaminase-like pyridoxal phosphate-dependent protein
MNNTSTIADPWADVETPALLLDMGAVERNIAKMATFFEGRECRLRPHAKTHKLPMIARKQIEAGAIGVTCARLDEAEAMLCSGIESVLIANEIVGASKIRRLVRLSRLGEIILCVDDIQNARNISDAAGAIGGKMNVLVEVNVGMDRCGVLPGEPTLDFVREVSGLGHLVFRGLMGYEGGLFIEDRSEKERRCRESNAVLVETAKLVEENGFPVEIVSSGGSNTYGLTGAYPGITEVQVGSYVTMDSHNREFGIDFEQALTVLTTVISRASADRLVVDAGKKAVSSDFGLPSFAMPGLSIRMLCEEHGIVDIADPWMNIEIGDKLEIVPSHGCTTIPLHSEYVLVRDGLVEGLVNY